jgi:hypothetical protein
MSGLLTKSLASWRKAHGFGILDIISPRGEYFLVETQAMTDPADFEAWAEMSEARLREHLVERGLSDSDVEEAIQLSKEWATTITGTSVFPGHGKSN